MATDSLSFPELVSQLDYAMFIVTTAAGDERAGCLVGFASQISIHCGFLLEPIDGEAGRGQSQLMFHRARRIEPGHDPQQWARILAPPSLHERCRRGRADRDGRRHAEQPRCSQDVRRRNA